LPAGAVYCAAGRRHQAAVGVRANPHMAQGRYCPVANLLTNEYHIAASGGAPPAPRICRAWQDGRGTATGPVDPYHSLCVSPGIAGPCARPRLQSGIGKKWWPVAAHWRGASCCVGRATCAKAHESRQRCFSENHWWSRYVRVSACSPKKPRDLINRDAPRARVRMGAAMRLPCTSASSRGAAGGIGVRRVLTGSSGLCARWLGRARAPLALVVRASVPCAHASLARPLSRF